MAASAFFRHPKTITEVKTIIEISWPSPRCNPHLGVLRWY